MIWVEILSRHREVAARFRFAGPERGIGRGYNNDVILDDPYVAAEHLRVFRDDAGRLVAEDLGSANGIYLERQRVAGLSRIIIDGKQPIRIGHTYLRIREANFAVEPERVSSPERKRLPVVVAAVLAVLLAVWTTPDLLAQTAQVQPTTYLGPLLALGVTVLGWAGIWALLSRVFSGSSRFLRNLLITLTGGLAMTLYSWIAQFVAYALTWSTTCDLQFCGVLVDRRGDVFLSFGEDRTAAAVAEGLHHRSPAGRRCRRS